MKLYQLLEFISAADLKRVERNLDAEVYQPAELVAKNKPVIDLEVPTSGHFMDRINQREIGHNLTPDEIRDLLLKAKTDPKIGMKDRIEAASKMNDPDLDTKIVDPKTKLAIPVIAKPNPECDPNQNLQNGVSVCKSRDGKKVPKNMLVTKTIFRQGVPD